jgi:hypothetical protein
VSYSWVDPHFAALYARREEERLAERLASRLLERAACEPNLRRLPPDEPTWIEQEIEFRGRFRLL